MQRRDTCSGRPDGKCAIILPDTPLLPTSGITARVKQKLLEEFNLHTIVRLPRTVFEPYTGISTNILFFDNSGKTNEIWYYQMHVAERMRGKSRAKEPKYTMTNPILYEDFNEIEEWFKDKKENQNAWKIKVGDLKDYDLDQKNPNIQKEKPLESPQKLIESLMNHSNEISKQIEQLKEIFEENENK